MAVETIDKTSEGLDAVSKHAQERLAQIQAEEQAKQAGKKEVEEPKGASTGDSSPEKKEKTEGATEPEQKKAGKTDEELLKAEDKDLNDDEMKKKVSLIKAKEDAKTPEEKLKDWQENTQKRIDTVVGELKAEREGRVKDADKIKELEATIASLRGELEASGSLYPDEEKAKQELEAVYAKWVDADKDKPRNERREMSDEELEEFLLEDYAKANQWIVRRELRRQKDLETKLKSKEDVKVEDTKAVSEFFTKFPECNQEKRHAELVKEGKTNEEAIEIIKKEVPDFKLMMDIVKEDKKYLDPATGPVLLAVEMEKRKSVQDKPRTYTEEEVKKRVEEEVQKEKDRLASLDIGLTSSASSVTENKDPMYQKGLELFLQAGRRQGKNWTEKDYKEVVERGQRLRKENP